MSSRTPGQHCLPKARSANGCRTRSSGLGIIEAIYGNPNDDPQQQKDVTQIVRNLIQDERLSFTADNGAMEVHSQDDDPAYLIQKALEIRYCVDGGPEQTFTCQEGEQVELP